MRAARFLSLFFLTGLARSEATGETTTADICIYGGTSGAVVAAVQAAHLGKSVILVSPDQHLGGMTSGGLGWTDLGSDKILGGLSLAFFQKIHAHYADESAWDLQPRSTFRNAGQGSKAINEANHTMSVFEPKVAEAVFDAWIKDNAIPVLHARLDRGTGGVTKDGTHLTAIRTEDGRTIRAKVFIDATYEGDLMAAAGVCYTLGREANAAFGETIDGLQTARAKNHQLPPSIDPFIKAGDPASGLLPGVRPPLDQPDGTADKHVQAYCYRLCLTNHPPNRVPIGKPSGYREEDYELLFRTIAAGQTKGFLKIDPLPNHKSDVNNNSGVSSDGIGFDDAYPDATYEERSKIAKTHENWQRGLIWTLQNHPRIPEAIRHAYEPWGLARDEFTDGANWPHALYIREARRMTSDFVMTQSLVNDSSPVTRPIAMGAYTMDSHNVQRLVGPDGFVHNEGDVEVHVRQPYRIDYGAIVPRANECGNLLVTFCLSSTHAAFGSIRMEPVFMALSQTAATAAALSLDQKTTVQDLPYPTLRAQLLKDGQKLE